MVLENCRAAYRIEDGVFWPTASTEEADALIQANTALSASQFGGAKTHLKNAASKLTEGDYPASVRESNQSEIKTIGAFNHRSRAGA
ncbi:hypothetical protein IVB03_02710 [Bradyrhizobium sp. 168]|uniref:hypothetical protein n=1 Tax=unclassified Bradyrhizobium TaxID=2631580 RepID=UPI001FF8123D|nr:MULTISPECIES: hypothetical protein [unclassified Bradyrhizobium]MCK1578520.1 hypothetical protein [Bradyrhizobium sp. 168]UPK14712.1 hypothetical protein IVA93_16845 [Bradyrhizobium sp. 155]UPK16379.1 hypothetical protein IVA73_19610 [Bradyrhizobium sp. 131]